MTAFSFFFSENNKKFFLYGIILLFIFIFFNSLLQFFQIDQFIFGEYKFYKPNNRFHLPFTDELVVGSMLIKLLPIFVGLAFYLQINKKIIFIISFIVSINIIFSGERSSFGLLLLFLFLSFFSTGLSMRKKMLYIAISFFISIGIIFSNNITKERYIDSTLADFFSSVNTDFNYNFDRVNIFSEAHTQHYIIAYDIFKNNYMFGSGPKTFREECKKVKYSNLQYGCTTHPHHSYVQLLSETGFFGFIFLLIFYFFILVKYIKLVSYKFKLPKKIDYLALFSSIAILINFFPFLPSGNFFNNWLNVLYFIPIAIFFYSFNHKENL